ncbi:MAG: adenylate/guanylate cyclase domain-containing protein [Rhodospirillales bacterium]|nr:adenylate/guanylate cyclase domain-containing protein [Rhodospirillales bacterium]MBT4625405.1 adenylate/guanylate cyclase domain-containing protein [Rhodospirillales bacterium]MBT7147451.1 adenylate/guanylate cyclase domain-containing protein [Rhodospirillales bacterium]MBT7778082.1 adenylate/guanylate cyclase domain-containing protein [Rhodospirillales bacterium]
MSGASETRRLAAILAADVAGYTKLVEYDTSGTVAAWTAARDEVVKPQVEKHRGKIVKLTGDGFLVEFPTVLDAVNCAITMQEGLASNTLNFRFGVNLGDIFDDGEDIHGEGVNVAARLEALASPGGIIVSGGVYDQIRNRINVEFEDMGPQQVKHVSNPIQAFAIKLGLVSEALSLALPETSEQPGSSPEPDTWKPSIAVLPFDNMSNDAEQEFFADGLTEDILTQLSRFNELFVISRNSTFTFKGKAVRAKDVAQELGVRYVLEGSVRKAGNRVRVTAQLIDGVEDRHVWAEKYDRDLEDIFDIQDEMTAAITSTLPGRIEADGHDRARRKPTTNMRAYECVLAGKVLHHRSERDANKKALGLLERAIKLDPNYVHARAWRLCVMAQAGAYGWDEGEFDGSFVESEEEIRKTLELDDSDADSHRVAGAIYITWREFDKAMMHHEKALSLNPNYDLVVVQYGELMTWMGHAETGIEWITRAMQLNPHHPLRFWSHLGRAYSVAHRYEDAIKAFKHINSPNAMQHTYIAASYAYLGDMVNAEKHTGEVLVASPDYTINTHMATQYFKEPADRDHHMEGLIKARLPLD